MRIFTFQLPAIINMYIFSHLKFLTLETVKQYIVSGIHLQKLVDNEKANHFCCLETLFVVYSTMPRQINK